jgi:beta-N-acetylhexosaminidase
MTDLAADAGQLCWIGFAGPTLDDATRARITGGACGAVILFRRNLRYSGDLIDLEAVASLNASLHEAAPDLWIAVDQEGGRVARVRAPATVWPPMQSFDRAGSDDVALAEQVGHAMGTELAALGFDIDFAPVLDVHSNDANPIIGDRAFGRTAQTVARRALAWARGLASAGILGCGKHFPGHGDTSTDSHLELPRIDHAMPRLEAVELAPFDDAARAGVTIVPMIMTAHVIFSAIDPTLPATLSPAAISVLRDRFGFKGLILSDDLDMKAIADHYGIADAACRAIAAGCDALLLCENERHQAEALDALIHRAERDSAFRACIAESAARIRTLKAAHAVSRPAPPPRSAIGSPAHQALSARLRGVAP